MRGRRAWPGLEVVGRDLSPPVVEPTIPDIVVLSAISGLLPIAASTNSCVADPFEYRDFLCLRIACLGVFGWGPQLHSTTTAAAAVVAALEPGAMESPSTCEFAGLPSQRASRRQAHFAAGSCT